MSPVIVCGGLSMWEFSATSIFCAYSWENIYIYINFPLNLKLFNEIIICGFQKKNILLSSGVSYPLVNIFYDKKYINRVILTCFF